ncbi:hypothetical protein NEHOM01_0429 [Nematocida homosporus]|uniref:uncharacterized protein n=1 Tax=Nematocida homosporus TaxID=1912981 RepID=UPI00221F039A|nr:uncharacterized protein NEHOM01_0429 [Nematocida homosporus]KAI5184827.1 hypothetical protein NEHOM01_0429 [Nematocida homosporus]
MKEIRMVTLSLRFIWVSIGLVMGLASGHMECAQIQEIINYDKSKSLISQIYFMRADKAMLKQEIGPDGIKAKQITLIWLQLLSSDLKREEAAEIEGRFNDILGIKTTTRLTGIVVEWVKRLYNSEPIMERYNCLFQKIGVCARDSFLLLLNPINHYPSRKPNANPQSALQLVQSLLNENQCKFVEFYWALDRGGMYQKIKITITYAYHTPYQNVKLASLVLLENNITKANLTIVGRGSESISMKNPLENLILYTPHTQIQSIAVDGFILVNSLDVWASRWRTSLCQIFKTSKLSLKLSRLRVGIKKKEIFGKGDGWLVVDVKIQFMQIQQIIVYDFEGGFESELLRYKCLILPTVAHLVMITGFRLPKTRVGLMWIGSSDQSLDFRACMPSARTYFKIIYWDEGGIWVNEMINRLITYGSMINKELTGEIKQMLKGAKELGKLDIGYHGVKVMLKSHQSFPACVSALQCYYKVITELLQNIVSSLVDLKIKPPNRPKLLQILVKVACAGQIISNFLFYASIENEIVVDTKEWDQSLYEYNQLLIQLNEKAKAFELSRV